MDTKSREVTEETSGSRDERRCILHLHPDKMRSEWFPIGRRQMMRALRRLLLLSVLITLVTSAPTIQAQCEAVKNTGSIAFPSRDAGKCLSAGTACSLGTLRSGTCWTGGGPGNWSCTCYEGAPSGPPGGAYVVVEASTLSRDESAGTAGASVVITPIDGFTGAVSLSCSLTGTATGSAGPRCTINPTSITISSSTAQVAALSLVTEGLPPGSYTINIVPLGSDGLSLGFGPPSLGLLIPNPKPHGGGFLGAVSFAALLVVWSLVHRWSVKRDVAG